ncbi:MAG: HD-GYP domain-containing protein, partial [Lachnospiraceae bacterium]|nr:HD-GYP domain-containing protein [Lachnospiraceae bacterium]
SSRVSEYAVHLAKELGWSDEKLENLRYQGLLHDIGKIGVPDSILNKPSKLSEREYEIIKQHTTLGARVLSDTTSIPGAWKVAKYHHERYDGKGYPDGLAGEDIPLHARIVGIADAYDAMSTTRVYRRSMSKEQIKNELVNGRGTQFDPVLTDHFLRLFDSGKLDSVGKVDRCSVIYSNMWENLPDKGDLELSNLLKLVQHNDEARGALEVDYEEFSDLYEYFNSIKKRYDHHFTICLMTITVTKGSVIVEDEIEAAQAVLRDIIGKTIRGVDVCSRINSRQLLVVLLDAGENASAIMERLENRFREGYPDHEFDITHEISEI